jgi:signal transduction histidine kinase
MLDAMPPDLARTGRLFSTLQRRRPLRLWLLTRWSARNPRRGATAVVAAFISVLGVGVLDSTTGSELSFAAFYALAVVAATVLAGAGAGMVTALWSSVLWGVADGVTGRSNNAGVQAWNGVVRFAVHGTVVVLVSALLRALQAARESEERSRSFLAAAAHQLRTPVAALSASVEALVLEGTNPGQERLLANVAGETSRLGRLVGALLRTARLDQGEPLRPVAADVVELCEAELDRIRPLSDLDWRVTLGGAGPFRALMDVEATREVVANVFDNARRHATQAVNVKVWGDREHVFVEVADDGPGLPAGSEQRAFERFVTLDGRGGTGLGLAIALELANRQGGDLTYERKTFRLELPAAPEPASRSGQDRAGGRSA